MATLATRALACALPKVYQTSSPLSLTAPSTRNEASSQFISYLVSRVHRENRAHTGSHIVAHVWDREDPLAWDSLLKMLYSQQQTM